MNVLGNWIREQVRNERLAKLTAMPIDELKSLWDRYPEDGSSIVDGHDLDEVHLVLSLKGHGDYCTV